MIIIVFLQINNCIFCVFFVWFEAILSLRSPTVSFVCFCPSFLFRLSLSVSFVSLCNFCLCMSLLWPPLSFLSLSVPFVCTFRLFLYLSSLSVSFIYL